MVKAISINDRIILGVPKFWVRPDGSQDFGYSTRPDAIHYADGWKDVVEPVLQAFQDKGQIRYSAVTDNFTYEVIPWSDERIKQQAIDEAEAKRQELFQAEAEKDLETRVMAPFQALTDAQALEKKDIYPIWEKLADGYAFNLNQKINALNDKKEVCLYKVIQAHVKQSDWHPSKLPALFSEIKMAGAIEIWTQPTGGDGKYPLIDPKTTKPYQVIHKGSTWENTHTGGLNVWEPGVFGWKKL